MSASTPFSNPFGYSDAVWQRFNTCPAAGRLATTGPGRLHTAQLRSRAADLELRLELRVEAGQVTEAAFLALGCPTTVATGQWLAEFVAGKPVQALRGLRASDIVAALAIREDRLHCALLGEDVLAAALKDLS